MGHAMLFLEGKRTGRGNKVDHSLNDFGRTLLSQARAVLAFSPELARPVRDGFETRAAETDH
jgi:hypothetical protein